jgi:class 3 adenylate cyclase/tetratricopeptide (TPR) repeat protein/tRNA A-37 threonylcarbamoyl transferase component Bud32
MEATPFGKYDLLERIASGGMAEVFLARATGLAGFERRLVIKRIREEHAHDPRFVQSFVNEARIGVHLNHPNIVQVYELGRVGDAWYIAMEHLHGRDLTRLRRVIDGQGERLPVAVAVRMVADVCRALAYAHTLQTDDGEPLGLVHRDVSPHNVVVTFSGEVKLVDFGIARLMHTGAGQREGNTRIGGGKYAYMSPEQARGEPLDHRTDLFSAGIVLWELLVGHRLFQHPDPEEKLRRVRQAVIPHPREEGVDLDDELWAILSKALARHRDDRYASAATLEEDLRAWLFRSRQRVERHHLAEVLRAAFPEEAARTGGGLHLHRLVADLERLDLRGESTTQPTGPDGPLPGRLPASVGERKPVVVLMIDVDGLTDLSLRLSPEALLGRRLRLLRWLREVVGAHGGLLQSTVDDHVTVLFGVPRARAGDLPRALRCALELVRDVPQLRSKGLSLELCIGVHTGEVTVGQGGRSARVRYVARGDTTRLARRLSSVADHGQVLASQRVVEAVEGQFDLRRGPGVPSRGGADPLPSWVVTRRSTELHPPHGGPWLRRGTELAVMRDAFLELSQGRGAAVALVGETGTGKSRFLREMRDLARRRGLPFYSVRCTPLGAERPLEPLRDLLAALLGQDPDTPTAQLLDAAAPLAELGITHRDRDALHALLGARVAHRPDRSEIWQAFRRLVRALTVSQPVILAFDDAHHLTEHGAGELARFVEVLQRVPAAILLGHRPPLPAPLEHLATVHLPALAPEQQAELAKGLLGGAEVSDDLRELLVASSEGNPLYLEELVKHLVETGGLVVDGEVADLVEGRLDLPHSLAALLAVRIDALDAASKGALQLAAVAGQTFSERLLAEAAGLDDPTPLIQGLAARHLVVRVPGTNDDWQLASALVRQAVLRGTLGVQRRDYHRLIAGAMERIADDPSNWAEQLMHHCGEGGRLIDAARYALRAGQALEREHALARAESVYEQGLAYVAQLEGSDHYDARVQGDAMLHLHLGAVRLLQGDTVGGQRALQLSLDIAADAGLPWIEVRAHVALGRHYLLKGPRPMARAHLDQAMALLRVDDEPEVRREALEALADLAFEEGDDARAEGLWEEALDLAGDDRVARARCWLGLASRHLRSGAHDRAEQLLGVALREARESGDRILEGRVRNNMGLLHSWRDDHDGALQHYRAALELRQSIGYTRGVAVNQHNLGDVHLRRGDRDLAGSAFTRSRDLARSMGWVALVALNDIYLAYLRADRVEAIEEAGAAAAGDPESEVAAAWLAGRWLIEHDEAKAGAQRLEQALALALTHRLQSMAQMVRRDLAARDGLSG